MRIVSTREYPNQASEPFMQQPLRDFPGPAVTFQPGHTGIHGAQKNVEGRATLGKFAMTERNWIYLAMTVFVTVSVFIAAAVWPKAPSPEWWIFFVQFYGVMVFTYGWESADARQLGQRQTAAAQLFTAMLVLVGHAVYLYQTRPWKRAMMIWLLYWAGVILIWSVATFVASAVL